MITPHLAKIRLHPIKSLDAVEVSTAHIAPHGTLNRDRAYAIFEGSSDIIKAKSCAQMHLLKADVNLESMCADFSIFNTQISNRFHLDEDRVDIGKWLSHFFQRPVKLVKDAQLGFADDWTATGPTIISTATIKTVASWFDDLSEQEVRARLRANLEIDGVPAFWEDQLYGPHEGELVHFKIGEAELYGKNACQRCPVPTRHSVTGEQTKGFSKIFTQQRKANLPPWAHVERFDHFYRVAVNTVPAKIAPNATLNIGDPIDIIGPASMNNIR